MQLNTRVARKHFPAPPVLSVPVDRTRPAVSEPLVIRATLHHLAALRAAWTTPVTHGSAIVVPATHLDPELAAASRLAHGMLDHRYYQVIHHSLGEQFQLQYLILRDVHGDYRGIHPFFVVQQDILAGAPGRLAQMAGYVRRAFPRFLTLKTLMVGNPAGPATLGLRTHGAGPDDSAWTARALTESLTAYASRHRIGLLVFKDFPAAERHLLRDLTHAAHGFARLPSMPMTSLDISPYDSFEDYMQRGLSKITRKGIRRKLREAAVQPLDMTVTHDISDCIDEVYRLYLQVYARATMTFEKLTPRFFLELGRRMPDRARFFLWRLRDPSGAPGRLVAASVTLVNLHDQHAEKALYDLYLGMEYPLALDLHLYFVTMRDIIDWARARGIDTYYSTPLCYDAKLHLKHQLVPQDVYVRHVSPWLNPAVKFAMRFAEPTRHDRILMQFPNAHELKD